MSDQKVNVVMTASGNMAEVVKKNETALRGMAKSANITGQSLGVMGQVGFSSLGPMGGALSAASGILDQFSERMAQSAAGAKALKLAIAGIGVGAIAAAAFALKEMAINSKEIEERANRMKEIDNIGRSAAEQEQARQRRLKDEAAAREGAASNALRIEKEIAETQARAHAARAKAANLERKLATSIFDDPRGEAVGESVFNKLTGRGEERRRMNEQAEDAKEQYRIEQQRVAELKRQQDANNELLRKEKEAKVESTRDMMKEIAGGWKKLLTGEDTKEAGSSIWDAFSKKSKTDGGFWGALSKPTLDARGNEIDEFAAALNRALAMGPDRTEDAWKGFEIKKEEQNQDQSIGTQSGNRFLTTGRSIQKDPANETAKNTKETAKNTRTTIEQLNTLNGNFESFMLEAQTGGGSLDGI